MAGDFQQLADHRFLRGRIAVVELQGVGPAGKVRIATVSQQQVARLAFDPGVVVRLAGQIEFGARDIILRMILHPRMIEAGVVGNEVQHQPHAAPAEPVAQPSQRRIAPEVFVNRVAGDREAGAADVVVAQVRQASPRIPCAMPALARETPASGRAGLPHAEHPNPIKALLGESIQLGVGDVVERRRPAQFPR